MSEEQTVENCLFCNIINGQVPSSAVYEDDTIYAFNDIDPKALVHVLVVPKKHYRNVGKVAASDPQLLAHMVEVAQMIADEQYNGQLKLVFNTGEEAGQTVFHAHAHVLTGENLSEKQLRL